MTAQPLPSDTVIQTRGLVRRFGAVTAVGGVDLDVQRGEILALLGPSGCGKTTMLRMLAGFEVPDAGSIVVDGVTVAGPRSWVPPERRRVGMVFQDYALFPHLTVAGNVAFGLPRRERRRAASRVEAVLDLVGLHGVGDRFPNQLSGGQQQRVALARALLPEPAVVLLDEPFSNLDASLRAQVRTEVHRILETAGATAIIVTHDQEEALSVADTVAVMHDGHLVQQAAPEDLYHAPSDRRVAAFVGDAEFFAGACTDCVIRTELGEHRVTGAPDGPVEVMVRPEELLLVPDPTGSSEVVGREFYGHDQMLLVRLDSGRIVRARLGPVAHLRTGDRCRIEVPSTVRTFASDGAGRQYANGPDWRARPVHDAGGVP